MGKARQRVERARSRFESHEESEGTARSGQAASDEADFWEFAGNVGRTVRDSLKDLPRQINEALHRSGIRGDSMGSVANGDVEGDIPRAVTGVINGTVHGDIKGPVNGVIRGDVNAIVEAGNIRQTDLPEPPQALSGPEDPADVKPDTDGKEETNDETPNK